MTSIIVFVRIFFAPLIVLSVHILTLRIYTFLPSFDIVMHFLGGVSIAYGAWIFFRILKEHKLLQYMPRLLEVFLLVTITSFAAVLWEFFEFTGGYLFEIQLLQMNLPDTIADLGSGLLGGLVMGGYLVFVKDQKTLKR